MKQKRIGYTKKTLEDKFNYKDTLILYLPKGIVELEAYEKNGVYYFFRQDDKTEKYYYVSSGRLKGRK